MIAVPLIPSSSISEVAPVAARVTVVAAIGFASLPSVMLPIEEILSVFTVVPWPRLICEAMVEVEMLPPYLRLSEVTVER